MTSAADCGFTGADGDEDGNGWSGVQSYRGLDGSKPDTGEHVYVTPPYENDQPAGG